MSLPTHLYQLSTQKFGRKSVPKLKVGETVRVHQRIKEGEKERIQVFEGMVVAIKHGQGLNGSYTVRRIAAGGVGVEKVFPLHLPTITKVERVKQAKVRRAKLYFLRQRAGKGARFANEQVISESWQEELDQEVGKQEVGEVELNKSDEPAKE